ncbi:hypothetical protein HOU02_gp324 [Caulobacter phage CcrBL9]|uniref:Uncharacterized protein n=1 Tax=Caulobacter phage CcrBL9 TaxID=2283270 RepID=A0A385EBZ1_9CAUD|nr:hypothetical protein HOU02_gp324 [Caulobacter phage CcrBL9]AXQ69401.1 hypothetical protein CcrBL9_gp377 [Caulobacter phage CcrBL9]
MEVQVPLTEEEKDARFRAAIAEAKKAWYPKSNEKALHDFSLPAIVRGFLALHQGPATEVLAIEEAGFMPRLFAKHGERHCQVTLVSAMDDIGISYTYQPDGYGYTERLSIYDLTDFTLTNPFRQFGESEEVEYVQYESGRIGRRKKRRLRSRL